MAPSDELRAKYGNIALVTLPLDLQAWAIQAVRRHPLTSHEDPDEMHRRIGWLICAWDVIVEAAGK